MPERISIRRAISTLPLRPSRPTYAQIDLKALAFNFKGVRRRVGKKVAVMAVVKANAYGHGMKEVARFLEERSVDYFGVALPEEAAELRAAGISQPILVFTLPSSGQESLFTRYGLEATICSLTQARRLNRMALSERKTIPVHIKIETGMNRIGIRPEQLPQLVRGLAKMRRLELKGLYTHFANADEQDKRFALFQLERFYQALDLVHREQVDVPIIHCANSAAILTLPESYFSMVRPGLMLYGYYPSRATAESVSLKPVLSLKSTVSLVKRIAKGESVGYGRRFRAFRATNIATLPIGYADGFSRLLSGKASVLIHGRRFPVVGTIAMDQLMVDVGNHNVAEGDEAVLIGRQGARAVSAWDLADTLGTIPYEILCWITTRVPRVYINP